MLPKFVQIQVPYHFDFSSVLDNSKYGSVAVDRVDVNWEVSFDFNEKYVDDATLLVTFNCAGMWEITMNLTTLTNGSDNVNLCVDKKLSLTPASHVEYVSVPESVMKKFLESKSLDILLSLKMTESGSTITPLQWWNELPSCITLKTVPDMCILVAEKNIPVHKSILSAKSNVFATMLNSDMSESVNSELHITDFSYDVVMSFLRCIYDEHCVDTELTSNGEQLLVIANKYEVMSLFQKAEKYLISTLTVDNVISLLRLADLHNSQLLKSEAMQVLADNSAHILQNVNLCEKLGASLCNDFILYTTGSDGSMCVSRKRKWKEITDDTVCPNDCTLVVSLYPTAADNDNDDDEEESEVRPEALCGEYCYIGNDTRNNAIFEKRGVCYNNAGILSFVGHRVTLAIGF